MSRCRDPAPDFVVATGDDLTDEELLDVMPGDAWSVLVGPGRESFARYSVRGPDEMRQLLRAIVTSSSSS